MNPASYKEIKFKDEFVADLTAQLLGQFQPFTALNTRKRVTC